LRNESKIFAWASKDILYYYRVEHIFFLNPRLGIRIAPEKDKNGEKGEEMKKMIAAISVIAILVTSGLALAQGWGRGSGRGYSGYGPCASGYGPANPSDWCPRFKIAPDQAQKGLTTEQRARQNDSRSGYRNYGPGYGMRG